MNAALRNRNIRARVNVARYVAAPERLMSGGSLAAVRAFVFYVTHERAILQRQRQRARYVVRNGTAVFYLPAISLDRHGDAYGTDAPRCVCEARGPDNAAAIAAAMNATLQEPKA